jgi:hypothetical protein
MRSAARGRRGESNETPVVFLHEVERPLRPHGDVADRPDARQIDESDLLEGAAHTGVAGDVAREIAHHEHFAIRAYGQTRGRLGSRQARHFAERTIELHERAPTAK